MAFFAQPATSIANCNALTISMWVELPTPAPSTASNDVIFSFFEFGGCGPFDGTSVISYSWVAVGTITDAGGPGPMILTGCENCGSVVRGYSGFLSSDPALDPMHGFYGYYENVSFNNTQTVYQSVPNYGGSLPAVTSWLGVWGSQGISSPNNPYRIAGSIQGPAQAIAADPTSSLVPALEINPVSIPSSTFLFGSWNHILLAVDTHDGKIVDPDTLASANTAYLIHNGVNIWGGTDKTGSVSEYGIADVPVTGPGIPVAGKRISLPLNQLASPTYPFSQNYDYQGGSFTEANLIKRRYGDVQVWFGKYIDPTIPDNYAKFVTIANGVGTPTNPTVAAAAFGAPTLSFKGKSSDSSFFTNRGTGGVFFKSGTITDFTPTPSY